MFAIGPSPSKVHLSVVYFATAAILELTFNKFRYEHDLTSFKAVLDKINFNELGDWKKGTRLDLALEVAINKMFNEEEEYGMRGAVPNAGFLITDGKNDIRKNATHKKQEMLELLNQRTVKAAKMLRKKKIELVIIGIGNKLNKTTLLELLENKENYYEAKDFEELISKKFVDDIIFCPTPPGKTSDIYSRYV